MKKAFLFTLIFSIYPFYANSAMKYNTPKVGSQFLFKCTGINYDKVIYKIIKNDQDKKLITMTKSKFYKNKKFGPRTVTITYSMLPTKLFLTVNSKEGESRLKFDDLKKLDILYPGIQKNLKLSTYLIYLQGNKPLLNDKLKMTIHVSKQKEKLFKIEEIKTIKDEVDKKKDILLSKTITHFSTALSFNTFYSIEHIIEKNNGTCTLAGDHSKLNIPTNF